MLSDAKKMHAIFGLMNSKTAYAILQTIAPTTNFEAGHMEKIPILNEIFTMTEIESRVENAIRSSMQDWDSYETSWDFKRNPLV